MLHVLGDSISSQPEARRGSLSGFSVKGGHAGLPEGVDLQEVISLGLFLARNVEDVGYQTRPEIIDRLSGHVLGHKVRDSRLEAYLRLTDAQCRLIEAINLSVPVTVVTDPGKASASLLECKAELVRAEHTEAHAHATKGRAAIEGVDNAEVRLNLIISRQQHLSERGLGDHNTTVPVSINRFRSSDLLDQVTHVAGLHDLVVSANDTDALISVSTVRHDLVASDGRSATIRSRCRTLDCVSFIYIKHY